MSFRYFHAIFVLFFILSSFRTIGSPYLPVLLIQRTIFKKLSMNWYIHSVDFSCNSTFSMTLSNSILYSFSRFCNELMINYVETEPEVRVYAYFGCFYQGKPVLPNEMRLFLSCQKDLRLSQICRSRLDLRGLGWTWVLRCSMVCIFVQLSYLSCVISFWSLWKRVYASLRSLVLQEQISGVSRLLSQCLLLMIRCLWHYEQKLEWSEDSFIGG